MTLKYIFHLSDLHIRNGDASYCRFNEYDYVFKNTVSSIKSTISTYNMTFNDFIIIITGDIFHNKNNIGNYGLLLYKTFVQELTKIGRLIIFSGNHDKTQSNQEQPTLVYSSSFEINNLTILNITQSFIIDNIGFSYVDINDTLDTYKNSGRIQDLPPFPLFNINVKYKIALFHGSFASVKLYNGENVKDDTNPYPLEWIKDFDYVLLGDIHKRQIFNYKKKTICGYSGSLIQQNFGEDIIDHGYLLWNIEDRTIKEINVYNNIGYINISEDADTIYIRTNGKYIEPLEKYIKDNINYFPKILEIKSFSNINFQTLGNLLNSFNISFQIVSKLNNANNVNNLNYNTIDYNIINDNVHIDNMIDTNYLLDYFKNLLSYDNYKVLLKIIENKDFLLFDINKYPEEFHIECVKRNKELAPIIISCNNIDDVAIHKKSFLIKYLEWEGLLCYENKNWLNFNDLDAKTFMIKGANGTGKSAIYDILLLAIWATNNKFDTYSSGFINHNKDKGYTIIDIEIDNIIYRIKRDFCRKKDTLKINNKTSVLYKYVNPSELIILKKDTACNIEVKSIFGDINTFLSTSMITQNVDNDILVLNYKDTLATIDKAHNIQYIYHLYNLFKTSINKYKDFRKIITGKKEVYEKLLFNDKNSNINDDVVLQLIEELSILNNDKNEMLKTYNSINIDINNPLYLSIIDTDYFNLINNIDIKLIVSRENYLNYKEKLNHYKYSANYELSDMYSLSKSYSKQLEDDFNKLPIMNKPCDDTVLIKEEYELYEHINNTCYLSYDCNNDQLIFKKNELIKNKELLYNLISNKPNKLPEFTQYRSVEKLLTIISKRYGNLEVFNEFISSNIKPYSIDPNILKELRASIQKPITLEHYNKIILHKDYINTDINNIKTKLAIFENDFKELFSKQQQITIKNKPQDNLTYKQFKSSSSITKELKNYNIDIIDKQIADYEIILNEYHKRIEDINKLDFELDSYKKELELLTSNEDYKYNPDCCVCCNRPWVSRIKEIKIIIDSINVNRQSINYSVNEYNIINESLEKVNTEKANYHLLIAWRDYYKFKETYDKITTDMNIIITSKHNLSDELINKENELKKSIEYTDYFIIYTFQLFDELNNIKLYENYYEWEKSYKNTKSIIEELEKTIHYNDIIKPRITKYRELKKSYNDWKIYDSDKKIIDSYYYYKFKEIIEINDLYNEYMCNEKMKPLIKQKLELKELISNKNDDIKCLNDKIVRYTTINTYNNENKRNYIILSTITTELDSIIDVIDTILVNFQSFRKELYENLILNKLVDKTNKTIKSLCHSNTKPFKLNYNVDISNDTVHINWLIHNDKISNKEDKQFISVSQASGFQHFVISLALRMSLYFNNYDVLCSQLFIDEGFINFDKNNLSIVPIFLKNLLHYFNTIVILSHIDIIQDSVDEIALINYIDRNSESNIKYSDCKILNIIKKGMV
jgi:DNA repair exonuclease SbcCD ATPase subunit/DNA repair exonuclease SbcCD nuclease subunit